MKFKGARYNVVKYNQRDDYTLWCPYALEETSQEQAKSYMSEQKLEAKNFHLHP